ncbi:heme ABC transporter ATP-binding protein [Ascidiaceihabitans sp.]|uniref:heme ABC transporter ATP-binding protein n=1 Tax=Ascidiaceihabitans sp. TaxID=1872644 RepID=UPI0032972929
MLTAKNLCVQYGAKTIIQNLNFTAQPAEITAIVGPNGSGKTTLLRALTAEVPYNGSIELNTHDISKTPAWQLASHRAVLSQATTLSFPFQAIEVVRMGLQTRSAKHKQLAVTALHCVGLAGFETRYYQELSGGEQQRVQLARVLCQVWHPVENGTPRWLFLDEPVSSLDIGHQLMVMQIAQDFAKAGGGVIAVMHDLNLSAMFAQTVVLMNDGRITGQGAPADILTDRLLSTSYQSEIRTCLPPKQDGWYVLPQAVEHK